MDVRIDPEFQAFIPPLAEDEFAQLEMSVRAEGCRDPLVLWNNIIVDGHHRYRICTKHQLPFKTVDMDFADREAAMDWMDTNQLGRRNLTPDQRSILRGRRYNRMKRQGERTDLTSGKTYQKSTTAEAIAKKHGVTEKTIRNDGKKAEAIEQLKRTNPTAAQAVIEGKKRFSEVTQPHVSFNAGENEWYTPKAIIEMAREVMGSIDCDPASTAIANTTVKASVYYAKDIDGLTKPWNGNVWLNPPYAQPLISHFVKKFINELVKGEIREACVLVNNATETEWCDSLMEYAAAACFLRGRVRFHDPEGKPGAPLQGQILFYYGNHEEVFDQLCPKGRVLFPSKKPGGLREPA
jgi:ParB family chromosome partitioning protein